MNNREAAQALVRLARKLMAKPPLNRAWAWSQQSRQFTAFASDLGSDWLDPWNRPLSQLSFRAVRDRTGEMTHWEGKTVTPEQKVKVELVVYND